MRTNVYKNEILDLFKKNHLLSISEIQKAIPKADFSTIFRNIKILIKKNELKEIVINHKETRYELARHAHDHFICNDCGDVEPVHITLPKGELSSKRISEVTVRGTCSNCTE